MEHNAPSCTPSVDLTQCDGGAHKRPATPPEADERDVRPKAIAARDAAFAVSQGNGCAALPADLHSPSGLEGASEPDLNASAGKKVYYTAPIVLANQKTLTNPHGWADEWDVPMAALEQRETWKDGKLVSLKMADVKFVDGKPLNPFEPESERYGRYLLGKYGPNHAADPILTADAKEPGGPPRVLVVVRADCGEKALPGGMIDDEDEKHYTRTLQREIEEEALEASEAADKAKKALAEGEVVYTGYVKDPRNTNNAWIETVAVWGHITAEEADALVLRPAPDGETTSAFWMDLIGPRVDELYASHSTWVHAVAQKLAAGERPGCA